MAQTFFFLFKLQKCHLKKMQKSYLWSIWDRGWYCTTLLLHYSACFPGTTGGLPCCQCSRCSIPPLRCGKTARRRAACGKWWPRSRCVPWSAVACRSETPAAVGRLPVKRIGSLRRPCHWTSCRSPRLDSECLSLKKALCALGSTTWFRKQVEILCVCVCCEQISRVVVSALSLLDVYVRECL